MHTIKFRLYSLLKRTFLSSISAFECEHVNAMECGYARYVGGPCGGSQQSPHTRQCLRIADCSKDIRDYLRFLKVGDPSITSEASLLLARAGMFRLYPVMCWLSTMTELRVILQKKLSSIEL